MDVKEIFAQVESETPDLVALLQDSFVSFDSAYSQFEQFYIFELMVIERDARRFIIDAIKVEKEMQNIENYL
jgi:hypothetical protein